MSYDSSITGHASLIIIHEKIKWNNQNILKLLMKHVHREGISLTNFIQLASHEHWYEARIVCPYNDMPFTLHIMNFIVTNFLVIYSVLKNNLIKWQHIYNVSLSLSHVLSIYSVKIQLSLFVFVTNLRLYQYAWHPNPIPTCKTVCN